MPTLRPGPGGVDYPAAQSFAAGLVAMRCAEEARTTEDQAVLETARGLRCTYMGGFGTYEVKGGTVRFKYTGGRFCSGSFTWEIGLSEDGLLRARNIRSTSPCEPERQVGVETNWTRVSPRSAAAGELIDTSPRESRQLRLSSESRLYGVWLLEGSGVLLRLSADGSYVLDDEGELVTDPDDQGTFEVDSARGTFHLTSGANSRTCAEGGSWIWANAELWTDSGSSITRLRGIVTDDACRKDLGPDLVWFRLQDLSAR